MKQTTTFYDQKVDGNPAVYLKTVDGILPISLCEEKQISIDGVDYKVRKWAYSFSGEEYELRVILTQWLGAGEIKFS